jgi:metallo-beta-lactamase family protein
MQFTSHGAARTTTGSRHLIEINGKRILLDCGLAEGRRESSRRKNESFPFDPKTLDAVILSHAHIDHSGNLPNLCQHGYDGNIYCTFATRDLCALMLQDSAKVQVSDMNFLNRRRAKQGLPPVLPLYGAKEVEKCMTQFVTLNYHRPFPVCDGITARFIDAGHMLGSAQVILEVRGEHKTRRLLFSGDIGQSRNSILRDPEIATDIDIVVMESTYGSREHDHIASANDELCRLIQEGLARGGKIIIPSFAVGRAQTILYALHQLRDQGCLPKTPIYVDSPLSINATEVFRLHPECFNAELNDYLHTKHDPFGWADVNYVRDVEQSKHLNEVPGPMIIISASGMCEAGRILHHLRNNISDPRNTILFVGHCGEHTLGHKILRGDAEINIFAEPFAVKAAVRRIDAFSGHADRTELLRYAHNVTGPKHHFIIVHGEENEGLALQSGLQKQHPHAEVILPIDGQPVPLPLG